MSEKWRGIRDFENIYLISSLGRVKSLKFGKERILKKIIRNDGYLGVGLYKNGKIKMMAIHRLVLESFVGMRSPKFEACHCNGKRNDNRLENLRWDSRSGNQQDRKKHNTVAPRRGELNGNSQLTEKDVLFIKKTFLRVSYNKSNIYELADKFNVSRIAISHIINNRTWRHI